MADAGVAELVYAHDSKSCLARDVGSSPTSGTRKNRPLGDFLFCDSLTLGKRNPEKGG